MALTAFFGGLYVVTSDFIGKNHVKEKLILSKSKPSLQDSKAKNKFLRFIIRVKNIIQGVIIFCLFFGPIVLLIYYGITKNISERVIVLASIIWGFLIMSFYVFGNLSREKEPWQNVLLIYAFLVSLCPMLIDIKKDKADLILSGYPNESVKFSLENVKITTNDTLIYIGQTKDFLFLRDLKANSNHIYNKEDIKKMIITNNPIRNKKNSVK